MVAARAAAGGGGAALATVRAAGEGGLVLTPGRKGGTWFVLARTRGAAALVADGFPALPDEGPQPVSMKARNPAKISNSPARRGVRE